MAKDTNGSVPLSKSQLNKADRLRKAAKKGPAPQHGGMCSSCGQRSTSCTLDTIHESCEGFYDGDFKNDHLHNLVGNQTALVDGSIIGGPNHSGYQGTWTDPNVVLSRLAEREKEAYAILEKQVIIESIYAEGEKFSHLEYSNGFGEEIVWHEGKWQTLDQLPEETEAEELTPAEEHLLVSANAENSEENVDLPEVITSSVENASV